MMQKIWSARTTCLAAAITWRRRARPPISWRTLGRLLLSRVPLPAAMMAMAESGVVTHGYGLTGAGHRQGVKGRERWEGVARDSKGSSLLALRAALPQPEIDASVQ